MNKKGSADSALIGVVLIIFFFLFIVLMFGWMSQIENNARLHQGVQHKNIVHPVHYNHYNYEHQHEKRNSQPQQTYKVAISQTPPTQYHQQQQKQQEHLIIKAGTQIIIK